MSSHTKKIKRIKVAAIACFIIAGVLLSTDCIITRFYSEAHLDNRLPPAGQFIKAGPKFTFAVMGDSAMRNEPLENVLADIRKRKAEFVLNVGDQARRVQTRHFEWLLQELEAEIGDFPFWAVPGNHDICEEGEDPLRFYKRAFGQENYWFAYGVTLFIGFNSSTLTFEKSDLEWLETVLERLRSQYKTCVLYLHIPPIDPRPGHNYCVQNNVDALAKIILRYKPDSILCGHIHDFLQAEFAGVPLTIIPSAGQKIRGKGNSYGYVLCTIDNTSGTIDVENIEVTSSSSREYLEFFLSSQLPLYIPQITLFFLLAGVILVVYAQRKKSVEKSKIYPK